MKNNHGPQAKEGNGEIPKLLEWQDQEQGDKSVLFHFSVGMHKMPFSSLRCQW